MNVCVLVKISSSNRSKCLSSILFAKKILFSLIITSLFLSLSLFLISINLNIYAPLAKSKPFWMLSFNSDIIPSKPACSYAVNAPVP